MKNKEELISSAAKWSDLNFQRPYSSINSTNAQIHHSTFDTHELLTKQYKGTAYAIQDKKESSTLEEESANFRDIKNRPQLSKKANEITSKIGEQPKNQRISFKPKTERQKGTSVSHLSYGGRIKQTLDEIKHEKQPHEFLDYSKYHRYKKAEVIVGENPQEYLISSQNQKMDGIDIKRILIDMKVPFNIKAPHSGEVKGPPLENQLSVFLKGNAEQIKELKEKVKQRGFEVKESRDNFRKSSRFTDDKISVENNAKPFMAERKEVGEITVSLLAKKKDLLKETDKNEEASILGIVG